LEKFAHRGRGLQAAMAIHEILVHLPVPQSSILEVKVEERIWGQLFVPMPVHLSSEKLVNAY